jgi:hypothetical protein
MQIKFWINDQVIFHLVFNMKLNPDKIRLTHQALTLLDINPIFE